MTDVRETGFKEVTRVEAAREQLRETVRPLERTDERPAESALGRMLASAIDARWNVPHYARAAMDGYAVRAADTFGASDRAPETLQETNAAIEPGEAVRVHTGSELPAGADAVVMVEHVDRRERNGSQSPARLEIFDAVAEGENVAPVGEDVEAGQRLYDPGHRLRPSDLGLLKAAGVGTVEVFDRPTVGVLPTGDELVGGPETQTGGPRGQSEPPPEPQPGEVMETNGATVARYIERWGGTATYRPVVPDDPQAVRAAIERDLTKDIIVTTGGSSVGTRDVVPSVVSDRGELLTHGVALKPGHPAAFGIVEDTPVLCLPGYPVACIVNAAQFLRPAVKWVGHLPLEPHPSCEARLTRKIRSEPGVRTFARVSLDTDDGETVATPTRAAGAGVLSSVALADGWVVIEEGREGIDGGDTVTVENWEWLA